MTNTFQNSAKTAFAAMVVVAAVVSSYALPAMLGSLVGSIIGGIVGAAVFDLTALDGQDCITLAAALGMLLGAGLAISLRARARRVA
ncbi:MAG: hypothetical protein EKK53_00835 [Burkholderiales bacterium]|nr:MAG: hypothetical protein EKK53_00835 [Burkholderiales bacterium]